MNSKFVYVEKHIRRQISSLYYDLLRHKCELERKVLTNALAIAIQNPAKFAYRLMGQLGYLAVVGGEVVHLLKCIQVDVTIRPVEECYTELPVFRGEEPYFLSPRTHILQKFGTKIDCNILMPTMFQFNNSWIEFNPKISNGEKPVTLKPQTKPTWKYLSMQGLAISGVYSNKDLDKIRNRIMFPIEKSSVLYTIALGMSGKTIDRQGMSIYQFFEQKND